MSRFLVNAALFVIALLLSFVTIVISTITHNLILLILVLTAIIALVLFLVVSQKGKAA